MPAPGSCRSASSEANHCNRGLGTFIPDRARGTDVEGLHILDGENAGSTTITPQSRTLFCRPLHDIFASQVLLIIVTTGMTGVGASGLMGSGITSRMQVGSYGNTVPRKHAWTYRKVSRPHGTTKFVTRLRALETEKLRRRP